MVLSCQASGWDFPMKSLDILFYQPIVSKTLGVLPLRECISVGIVKGMSPSTRAREESDVFEGDLWNPPKPCCLPYSFVKALGFALVLDFLIEWHWNTSHTAAHTIAAALRIYVLLGEKGLWTQEFNLTTHPQRCNKIFSTYLPPESNDGRSAGDHTKDKARSKNISNQRIGYKISGFPAGIPKKPVYNG